jgi:hypothetical protein
MASAQFITPSNAAAVYVANHMREADRLEVASLGVTPHRAIEISWNHSTTAHMVAVGGSPSILFGVCPESVLTRKGIPWLLATDGIELVSRRFLRECRGHLDAMFTSYDTLSNMVSVDNAVSIRWLEWMGFQFGAPVPAGIVGQMFYPFTMRSDH